MSCSQILYLICLYAYEIQHLHIQYERARMLLIKLNLLEHSAELKLQTLHTYTSITTEILIHKLKAAHVWLAK